jgi:cytochrome c-type biogenesis protein CcmH/NrfG
LIAGQHSQVIRLLRESALHANANDWQLWHLLGCELLHQFDLFAAKEAFQHALQTSNQVEPFVLLSQCHLLESDPKSAIFVLRRAVE